jgi:hypothetical protein
MKAILVAFLFLCNQHSDFFSPSVVSLTCTVSNPIEQFGFSRRKLNAEISPGMNFHQHAAPSSSQARLRQQNFSHQQNEDQDQQVSVSAIPQSV